MFDELTLGRNFKVACFSEELRGSSITYNGTVGGFPTIVSEQLNFQVEFQDNGQSSVMNFYGSRIGQFESLNEIELSSKFLADFRPNFNDDKLEGFIPGATPLHRVVDIHNSGAILFYSNIVQKDSDGIVHIEDAGFFMQEKDDSIPVPVPEENVLGFTKDTSRLVLSYLDESQRVKLLIYNVDQKDFKNFRFTEEVTDFLGGALDGNYLCMIQSVGADGTEIPHLVRTKESHMKPIKNFSEFGGFSEVGVVIGNTIENKCTLNAAYMHANGRSGALNISDNHLSALPRGISEVPLDNQYFVITGSAATINVTQDPLSGTSIHATPSRGELWIASELELREGMPVTGEPIEDRILNGSSTIKNLTLPAPDMRIVGSTINNEDVLLIPS